MSLLYVVSCVRCSTISSASAGIVQRPIHDAQLFFFLPQCILQTKWRAWLTDHKIFACRWQANLLQAFGRTLRPTLPCPVVPRGIVAGATAVTPRSPPSCCCRTAAFHSRFISKVQERVYAVSCKVRHCGSLVTRLDSVRHVLTQACHVGPTSRCDVFPRPSIRPNQPQSTSLFTPLCCTSS